MSDGGWQPLISRRYYPVYHGRQSTRFSYRGWVVGGEVRRGSADYLVGLISPHILDGEVDELGWVTTTAGEEDVVLTTRMAKTLRFKQAQVRSMGRPASGVRGIALRDHDEVISMDIISPALAANSQLVTIAKNGKGKRTPINLYRPKGRGTQGMQTMGISEGDTIAIARVIDADMLLTFITSNGIVLKTQASQIRACGRAAQGVRVLSLDENDSVVAMAADEPEDDTQKQKRILDLGDMVGVDMFESSDDESDESEEPANDE